MAAAIVEQFNKESFDNFQRVLHQQKAPEQIGISLILLTAIQLEQARNSTTRNKSCGVYSIRWKNIMETTWHGRMVL